VREREREKGEKKREGREGEKEIPFINNKPNSSEFHTSS
jgi:hypothetical protein